MIRILDKDLRFVSFLTKYTFSQYVECFRDIGAFQIDAEMAENQYLVDKSQQYFVLFDSSHFGIITGVEKQSDSEFENNIKITGKMANNIFERRIVYRTIKFNGQTKDFVKTVIEDNMIDSEDTQRNMNMSIVFDTDSFTAGRTMKIDKSVTGGTVWDRIQPVLDADRLGIEVIPVITPDAAENETLPNIRAWKTTIKGGMDRTKGNTSGNAPVIFSQSYSNIQATEYINKTDSFCNVAYCAGEGEGEARKWFKRDINQSESKGLTGWNRSELWIDARDLQSEDTEGNTLSDAEYEALINTRINEKAEEATIKETYNSTVIKDNKQYVFGKDYFLGDFVTVVDDELGITINVQVTEVTVSEQDTGQIVDIGLTYGAIDRDVVTQAIENTKNIENTNNNIKYLENKIKKIETSGGGGNTGGDTPSMPTNIDDIQVTFTEATARQNIQSGEVVKTLFGKIKKIISDLKTVAYTGSYDDLTNKPSIPTIPSSLPANGGHASTADSAANATNAIDSDKLDGKHGEYYLDYNNLQNRPSIPDSADTSGLMPKSGGTFTGTVSFSGNDALPSQVGLTYILGINAFAQGGIMRWSDANDVKVGNATKFSNKTETQWKEWINSQISNAPAKIALGDVKALKAESTGGGIKLSWEDPDNIVFNGNTLAEYGGTKVLRKQGSYSESEEDGTIVVDETVKNSYKVTPFFDTEVEAGVNYNYTLFPRTVENVVTLSDKNKVSGMALSFDNIFENNTWEQIAYASETGIANTLWSVGDTKDGCTIIGFNHDTIYESSDKAGITFVCKNNAYSMSGVWNSNTSYVTEYNNSTVNVNLNYSSSGVYATKIPDEIKKHIKKVEKEFLNTISGTMSNGFYVFLFSAYEIWGSGYSSKYKEGNQYDGAGYIDDRSSSGAWLRTRKNYTSNEACYVISGGRGFDYVNKTKYYLYGFCI